LLMDAIAAASYMDGDTLVIDRAGVREHLNGVSGYDGLIGNLSCDAYGDCSSSKITVIQNIDTADYEASTGNVVFEYAPTGSQAGNDVVAAEDHCIGLVTDVGQVDDKSFNQSAWEGAQSGAEAVGASVDYIETQDAKDYANNIAMFADSGCEIIVTVGFGMGEATVEAAGLYPDVYFIGVDQFQGEELSNVVGLMFAEDKAGFLAGALAASLSETGVIAAVLGTNLVPPVQAFGAGYANGAAHINPDIEVIKTYHPGGFDIAFSDPEWGGTTARQAMDSGADVVFGAGGKTGNGALIEVAGEAGAFCIGVDTDQWDTVPEAHPCLVTSAMKLITPGVADLIVGFAEGNEATGNSYGSVGLASHHDLDSSVSQEIQDMIAALDAALMDGSQSTGYSFGDE